MRIFAEHALLPQGWQANVAVSISGLTIGSVEIEAQRAPDDVRVSALLPALSGIRVSVFADKSLRSHLG